MPLRSLTRALLEHLSENKYLLIDALLPPGYGETHLSRAILGLDNFGYRYASRKAAKRSLSSILSRLKREGLVSYRGSSREAQWRLTRQGKAHLETMIARSPPLPHLPPQDGIVRIVTFDVPEKQRGKRKWLRAMLIFCDYQTLHKSVYLGTRPLPQEIIHEIDDLGLSKFIHIAGIGKKGTLKKA